MEIKVYDKGYGAGGKFHAQLLGSTNKWYANYEFQIDGGGDTEERAIEALKEKAKEMIQDLCEVIYK